MTKSRLYSALLQVFIGAVLISIVLFTKFQFENLFWGFGFVLVWTGIKSLIEYMHWSKPENIMAYNEKKRIERTDERNIMLRDKSGRIISSIMLFVQFLLLMFFYSLSNRGVYMPLSFFVFFGILILLIFQMAAWIFLYNYLDKGLTRKFKD